MKFKIFMMVVLIFLSTFLSVQAQPQPCTCANKKDMLNLLNMVESAIQEYVSQLTSLEVREKETGQTELISDQKFDDLQRLIHAAINSVRGKSDTEYGLYEMNYKNCSVRESLTQNECVRQIEKNRFDFQKTTCEATKNLPNHLSPYLKMKAVIQHEIDAFLAMRNFILKLLKALPKDCRPNNWFGYVVYQKVQSNVSVKTIPAQNTSYGKPSAGINIINGGNGTTGVRSTYLGTVFVENGKAAQAKAHAVLTNESNNTFSGRTFCSRAKPDLSFVSTSSQKALAEGDVEGKADFSLTINSDNRKYSLSVYFFPVNMPGRIDFFSKVSGTCQDRPPINNSNTISEKAEKHGSSVSDRTTRVSTFPEYLVGSEVTEPPLFNQTTQDKDVTNTTTLKIQFRWMLRRLPPK